MATVKFTIDDSDLPRVVNMLRNKYTTEYGAVASETDEEFVSRMIIKLTIDLVMDFELQTAISATKVANAGNIPPRIN